MTTAAEALDRLLDRRAELTAAVLASDPEGKEYCRLLVERDDLDATVAALVRGVTGSPAPARDADPDLVTPPPALVVGRRLVALAFHGELSDATGPEPVVVVVNLDDAVMLDAPDRES